MAAGVMTLDASPITSSITVSTRPGSMDVVKDARKYTWNDGIVAAYLGYRVCRGLLVDLKRLIGNLDRSCEQTGINNPIVWMHFSQRVVDRMIGVRFDTHTVRDSLVRGTAHREFRYKDIDAIIEFFEETYSEMFSDPRIEKRISPFLADMNDGVGKVSDAFSMLEGGMLNHTLIEKAMRFPSMYPVRKGRGFTDIGEVSRMEGDYFTRKEIQIRSLTRNNNQMETVYLQLFWGVVNRVVGIMSAASRVASYYELRKMTGEVDTMINPPLVVYSRPTDASSSCIQVIMQLDGLFRVYQEKRRERRMSLLRSRSMMRKGGYRGM